MIKALAVGLGLVLSFGVASAQPKKSPGRKKPAHGPVTRGKKSDPKKATSPSADPATEPSPDGASPSAKDGAVTGAKDGTLPGAKDGTLPGAKDGALPGAKDGALPAANGGDPASPAKPAVTPPPGAKLDASPSPAAGGDTGASAAKPGSNPPAAKPGAPLKTDEKASTTQGLQRSTSSQDYRNVSPEDERLALIAFREGNVYLNDGLFKKAAEKYREALARWNHPAIHYNLALALINLDQPIEVFDALTSAMAYGPEPLEGKEKFERANQYMRLVQGQLADIEVTCNKAGAKISVDGKEVFTAPGTYKAKVRVGKHTFYGELEGYNARVTAPFIGAGEPFRIELKLYTYRELTRYHRRWEGKTWMPYVVLGAGALVGLVGGGFELLARSDFQKFDDAVARCNTTSIMNSPMNAPMGCAATTSGLLAMRSSGTTKRTIGAVGYGVAGAAIVTGAVLALLNRRQPYQINPEELEKEQAKRSIAITPVASPQMMGAMVQGHF